MIKSLFISIVVLGLFTSQVWAVDFMPGKILLKDGSDLTGMLKPPTNKWEKVVEFKANGEADIVKIKSSAIDEIAIKSKSKSYRLIFKELWLPKKENPQSEKDYKVKKPFWSIEVVSGFIDLYAQVGYWKFDKKGDLLMNVGSLNGSSDIFYYAQTKDLKKPVFVGIYSLNMAGQMKYVVTLIPSLISDYTELVERVKNKEFQSEEIDKIFEIYNNWKKGTEG